MLTKCEWRKEEGVLQQLVCYYVELQLVVARWWFDVSCRHIGLCSHCCLHCDGLVLVLLRCHFFQGRSVSVGVSVKKSVLGLGFDVYRVYMRAPSATVRVSTTYSFVLWA